MNLLTVSCAVSIKLIFVSFVIPACLAGATLSEDWTSQNTRSKPCSKLQGIIKLKAVNGIY
jgi:hypothetical protein